MSLSLIVKRGQLWVSADGRSSARVIDAYDGGFDLEREDGMVCSISQFEFVAWIEKRSASVQD